MSFSDFKKRSLNSIDELSKKLEATNSKESFKDDRFWRPELDKVGNGYAVIRFLPTVEGEDVPWAKYYSHGFQGKGGWLIENCPTSLGMKCPVCEANSELWNSGVESDKDVARNRKRRLHYVSNIFVVSDPANPENEGKIFLLKYGKKIFDKIQEAMQPEFEDEDPINPFDFWGGANFKMKVRKVAGFVNYDKSEFAEPSALLDGDDSALEALWKKQYPLLPFVDPSSYKSYDELKSKLDRVLGDDVRSTNYETKTAESSDEAESSEVNESGDSENMDALSYFEKLANE
tara:strand:- start:43 stop:909 length:867 start_codon:yes stop_codon:yes gene_type:complete